MLRSLSNLIRDIRTAKKARPAQRTPRRVNLQLEGLEDRMLMASAILSPTGTLQVNADPGLFGISFGGHVNPPITEQINFQADAKTPGLLDVSEGSTSLGQFSIAAIKNVNVNLAYLDNVNVDDSNGLPLAHGTSITVSGSSNIANSLNVTGSRSVSGNETYEVGGTGQGTSLVVDNLEFLLNSTIGSVTDSVKPEGGSLNIESAGQNVSLTGSNGVTQTLSGLGVGGGGTFTFSNQNQVGLDDDAAANAVVALNATAAAAGEHSFNLFLTDGTNDQVYIQATPSTVTTSVNADLTNNTFVYLESNLAPVSLAGNSSTFAGLGQAAPNGLDTLAGIKANVSVSGVGHLNLADNGNTTTQENVTVTESTISGTGLFGNNAVQLTYSDTANVAFLTGQLQDTYNIAASSSSASFSSNLSIFDFSRVGLNVQADLDAKSALNLNLVNSFDEPNADLTVLALGATFSKLPPTLPNGVEDVTFPAGLTSTIAYQGYSDVTLINSIPHF